MSVPVNQRKTGKLEVCLKAHDLCVYTLQITKNKKIFTEEYQESLTDRIISEAMDIHLNVWMANNVKVTTASDYDVRRKMQTVAISKCASLLALIDIAKSIFHLSGKRVMFWGSKVVETRNLIRAWRTSDAQRYKNLIGM